MLMTINKTRIKVGAKEFRMEEPSDECSLITGKEESNNNTPEILKRALGFTREMIFYTVSVILQHEEIFYLAANGAKRKTQTSPSSNMSKTKQKKELVLHLEKYPYLKGTTLEILKEQKYTSVALAVDIENFNVLYDKLSGSNSKGFVDEDHEEEVEKSNIGATEYILKMVKLCHYTPLCIINNLAKFCIHIHQKLNRDLFDTDNLEDYLDSVASQLKEISDENFINMIAGTIKHNCGEKYKQVLEECNVNLPKIPHGTRKYSLDNILKAIDPQAISPTPIAHTFKDNIKEKKSLCVVCGVETTIRCSKCKARYVCSTQCQKQDWPKHKTTCIANKLP